MTLWMTGAPTAQNLHAVRLFSHLSGPPCPYPNDPNRPMSGSSQSIPLSSWDRETPLIMRLCIIQNSGQYDTVLTRRDALD